jgi:hypothetical protein
VLVICDALLRKLSSSSDWAPRRVEALDATAGRGEALMAVCRDEDMLDEVALTPRDRLVEMLWTLSKAPGMTLYEELVKEKRKTVK